MGFMDAAPQQTWTVRHAQELPSANHEVRLASIGNISLGVWLLVAGPFLSAHADVGTAVGAEFVAGTLVLVLASISASRPARARLASLLTGITGAGLMLAPVVLGHGDAATAVLNELVVGLAIVSLAVVSHLLAEPS